MARRLIIALAALAAACNNPDTNDDGRLTRTEYCTALIELEDQSEVDCGEVDLQDADAETCAYLAERCDFDEAAADACIGRIDAFTLTCEDGDGSGLEANPECLSFDFQGAVFFDCAFDE